MDLNLQESELLYTFDFGVKHGSLITGQFALQYAHTPRVWLVVLFFIDSDYIWCVNGKEDGLLIIKNIKDKNEISLPYHNFGIASNVRANIRFLIINIFT